MADPGFSRGGGANSQKCYYFSIFCRKLHENERIWTPRGGRASLAPPLGSANGPCCQIFCSAPGGRKTQLQICTWALYIYCSLLSMLCSFVLKTNYLIHFIMIFLASNFTLIELEHWYWAVFLMSLDSIIFVCKCLVQCDLLRVTEAFSCKRAWQQKSAEWSVSIVNRASLLIRMATV